MNILMVFYVKKKFLQENNFNLKHVFMLLNIIFQLTWLNLDKYDKCSQIMLSFVKYLISKNRR